MNKKKVILETKNMLVEVLTYELYIDVYMYM